MVREVSPAAWCLVAGDNHGRFEHLVDAARRYRPQHIISVGDLDPSRPLAQELAPIEATGARFLFCHGNHESDRAETWAHFETASDRNMHGRVVQIGDLTVAFLGGVFLQEIWHPPQSVLNDDELFGTAKFESYEDYVQGLKLRTRPSDWESDPKVAGLLRKHRTTIFPNVYRDLQKRRADVLISHEAGAWAHEYGFAAIDHLRKRMGAKSHFFGHHHARRYRKNDAGEISVGVGLCGIVAIDGTVIRPGDLDRERAELE